MHLKDDLRSLPRIVTHWGFLAALGAAIASTAVFIASTNDFASSLDVTLSNPGAGKALDGVSNLSYIAVSLFVAPPPAAGAFLVGFTAPRASWLGGLIYGLIAAGCYSVILLSPTGRLFVGSNDPQPYVANAWIVGPLGAMFFAAASAWYKRFLNLANPNRGRKPEKAPPKGRGNAKPNSRGARADRGEPAASGAAAADCHGRPRQTASARRSRNATTRSLQRLTPLDRNAAGVPNAGA